MLFLFLHGVTTPRRPQRCKRRSCVSGRSLPRNGGTVSVSGWVRICVSTSITRLSVLDVGYTLRIIGADTTWSATKKADPNEWIRHRVFFGVTGSYAFDYAKIHLRERVQLDMRTDSVNVLEKNKCNVLLRSRVGAEALIPGKPVKPYLWVELINTLNAPEYQRMNGRQFITDVRTQAGVKWRITRLSSLDFFYRFSYGYDRDINITKKNGYIQLTEEKCFMHSIGIYYNLEW